jgi:hypothetical protein
MEREKIFGSYKQKLNLLSRIEGIHIDTIMSTPRMENRMQIEGFSYNVHHNEVVNE